MEGLKGKLFKVIDRIKHDGKVIEAGKVIAAGEHLAEETVEALLRLPHPPIKPHTPGAEDEASAKAAPARAAK